MRHRGCVASYFGRTASNSGGQIKVYWFLFCFVLLCTTIFIQTISILKTPAPMTREHRSSTSRHINKATNRSLFVGVFGLFGSSKLHTSKSSIMRADLFCYFHSCRRLFPSYDRVVFFVSGHKPIPTPIPMHKRRLNAAPKMFRYESSLPGNT
ncbi:uncharacterized protein TRIVIDRAFT_185010 [Trichoderma virens Gv29-8]|uniref:Uncharacterized protein n=1 Tax=Hypocrea virens (strain Gv29-8 / FGSC 10586) TaxID=413071 RepID=G9NCZ6_HYPVG|nr:uncharacterized protein TRIVIDRAFT_185010 [Trichoderma virens Gv29-8]EHK15566.1 hypothetical protein TRIVIDRAFT_92251 [Trichoderma virens Gv29-8]